MCAFHMTLIFFVFEWDPFLLFFIEFELSHFCQTKYLYFVQIFFYFECLELTFHDLFKAMHWAVPYWCEIQSNSFKHFSDGKRLRLFSG